MKALLKGARSRVPRLRISDSVGDLRLAETRGGRDALAADMAGAMSLLGNMGAKFHTKGEERWWPTCRISRLGFEVGARLGAAKLEERQVQRGTRLREEIFEASPGPEAPARALLASVSCLNFLRWVIPGGFCHLRSGRDAVNASGAVDR